MGLDAAGLERSGFRPRSIATPSGELTLDGWNTYQLDVPASALQRGINVLTFDFDYARSPHEVLGTADTRALSVAVDWMRWTSE